MADKILFRRDTKERCEKFNPVLSEGEIGYVKDSNNQYKIGDGVRKWSDLPLQGFSGNIDSELSETSTNPVENRVVTNKIFYLDNNKYDKIYNQDKTIDSTVKSGTTYIEVNFIKDTEYYITLNFLNFIQPDRVNGIYTYNKQSSGEIVENIYDKLVESPYNTVAVKFIPTESCVYIGISCSLFSESEQIQGIIHF